MKEILNQFFLSNPISLWLWVLGVIMFVVVFARAISRYLVSGLNKFLGNRWSVENKVELQNRIIRPLSRAITTFVSVVALDKLAFPEVFKFSLYGHKTENILPKIGELLIIVTFFGLVLGVVSYVAWRLERKANATANTNDDQLIFFLRELLKVAVIVLAILTILQVVFNKDIRVLLQGLTIIGAALALAAKESLENLIASFIIFFDKPFYAGDFVKVNNISGTVERIGLRSTRIRTADRTVITIPNKQMVDTMVDNVSMRGQIRNTIPLEFDVETSDEKLKQFQEKARAVLTSLQDVQNPSVYFNKLSKSSADINIEYFTEVMPLASTNNIKQQINFQLQKIIADVGIKFSGTSSTINIVQPQEQKQDGEIL